MNECVMEKKHFAYQLMIRQPDFVTKSVAKEALAKAANKIASDLLEEIKFITIEEGLVAQILHVGSYDEEGKTFEQLEQFIQTQGY